MKLTSINAHNIRRLYYHIRHNYITLNNGVIALAAIVAIGWAWGSVSMMQRNYTLQKKVDTKERELQLVDLQVETLQYEQAYYKSAEYQDLAARKSLGLVTPGEKVLILPANSDKAKSVGAANSVTVQSSSGATSNFDQWMRFFSGADAQK